MSDAVSEAEPKAKKAKPAAAVAAAAAATQRSAEDTPPEPSVEHNSDLYETRMEYDPTAKVPIIIVLVWICAIVGFVAYCARYLFPELALWGSP
jgi:hypothetical protein